MDPDGRAATVFLNDLTASRGAGGIGAGFGAWAFGRQGGAGTALNEVVKNPVKLARLAVFSRRGRVMPYPHYIE